MRNVLAACLALSVSAGAPLLAGCKSSGDTSTADAGKPAASYAVTVASSPEALASGASEAQFDLTTLRHLWVRVTVPRLDGTRALKLVFVDPSGRPFYEDNAAFAVAPTATTMDPGNGSLPLNLLAATAVDGGYALDRAIPVAGTVFERSPHYGTWIVQAELDGMPSMSMASFQLTHAR